MKKKGFTLIELLVVIAIIALLMGILMPALNQAKRLAERLVCGANLKGLGNAMHVYAADNKEDFPQAGPPGPPVCVWSTNGVINRWWSSLENPGDDDQARIDAFTSRQEGVAATVTSSLYLLVRYASVTPSQFVCKGDGAQAFKIPPGPHPGAMLSFEDGWDFGGDMRSGDRPPGMCNSYAYNMPYFYDPPVDGEVLAGSLVINDSFNPGMAVLADRNPHLDNRVVQPEAGTNSAAHQGKGQSVLYKDGSREWREEVTSGLSGDNIYTRGGDYFRDGGTGGGDGPTGNGDGGPYGRKDSYLVSETNFQQ